MRLHECTERRAKTFTEKRPATQTIMAPLWANSYRCETNTALLVGDKYNILHGKFFFVCVKEAVVNMITKYFLTLKMLRVLTNCCFNVWLKQSRTGEWIQKEHRIYHLIYYIHNWYGSHINPKTTLNCDKYNRRKKIR